jgi:hypothetical protein
MNTDNLKISTLHKQISMIAYTCNPGSLGGRSIGSQPAWANSTRLYLKNKLKRKKSGGVAQVVEHGSTKLETLNSIPGYKQKKKKKKKITLSIIHDKVINNLKYLELNV